MKDTRRRWEGETAEQYHEYRKGWWAANPDKTRSYKLKKYGITIEDYKELLERQGGHCALCPRTRNSNGKSLCVDHDHSCCPGDSSCGKCIRGLLCDICNTGLGKFEDNPSRLRRAAGYVEGKING